MSSKHVVLMGDSIFDNGAYVAGGPDVITQLRDRFPADWTATLKAVDGSVTENIAAQLQHLPAETSHLVISAGGNDALGCAQLLYQQVSSMGEALEELADLAAGFEKSYRAMLKSVLSKGLPTALCTVYYPRFPETALQRHAVTALTVFNDVILLSAFTAGFPVLDLRLICSDDADYANPIEPSVQGGRKIANAIVQLLNHHDFGCNRTQVFIG